ncbi:MAG: phage Gp37/Gp68 family protein, partial [Chloroflexota bacterium]|nr:phage Gp37/Gp68 family protein [Chloroflexota bacterium]
CYAMHFARRFDKPGRAFEGLTKATSHGTDWSGKIRLRPQKLREPFSWKQPERVFVDSMSDLFHHNVPDEFLLAVLCVIAANPRHDFQVLTKRPERMRHFLGKVDRNAVYWGNRSDLPLYRMQYDLNHRWAFESDRADPKGLPAVWEGLRKLIDPVQSFQWPLPNLWLGVSVEDQAAADKRIPDLLETPAAVRFLSCEPLLGPVDLEPYLWEEAGPGWAGKNPADPGLDWVIVGGESGHGARPMHPDWARSLRDQCRDAKVALFFKQWGEYRPPEGLMLDQLTNPRNLAVVAPDGTQRRHEDPMQPGDNVMVRVGKHKAGRVLDGRTWDQMPVVSHA